MHSFKSTGPPHIIQGRGIVRAIQPWDYGDITWGELTRIQKEQEWVRIDLDIVTIAGIESFAIMRDDDKKFGHPIGLLIGKVKEPC